MAYKNRELWSAFVAMVSITLGYLFVTVQLGDIPAASDLFGHGLGIVGFTLMLLTETLYSWRKRSRSARWGRMSGWLRFHIFTGLVGPFMVLLHSSWKFNGLAGAVMLLTVIIVLSGIVGRYIYTAIPRTADGAEIEASALEYQIAAIEGSLHNWHESQPEIYRALAQTLQAAPSPSGNILGALFDRTFSEVSFKLRLWRAKRKLAQRYQAKATELENLFQRQRTLQRQIKSLILARRWMALWHTIHIPIGIALFATACVHILGAIYYATLLR